MRSHLLLLIAIVVLGGCVSSLGADQPREAFDAGTTEQDRTVSPSPETPPAAANPWGKPRIKVAATNASVVRLRYAPLVRRALDYWNGPGARHAGYRVLLGYEDAGPADVLIRFVDEVPACGSETTSRWTAGCAPVIDDRHPPTDEPVVVYVKASYTDDSIVQVLKHELGHVLGLEHGDAPVEVMAHGSDLTYRPLPDADERALPWRTPTLRIYVDRTGVAPENRTAVSTQLQLATDYYASGAAEDVPANVSFTEVAHPDEADILVRFPGPSACDGTGSCATRTGYDLDDDGTLEYYTRLTIEIGEVDIEAVGWHLGYWLAAAFGAEDEADRPPPFRDAGYDDRRTWWQ